MRKILTALILLIAPPLAAEEVTLGDLTISDAYSYATPAKAGAAYLTVTNAGDTADRLTGAEVDFADAQLHESKADSDGVMRMQHLMDGVAIPAGETVTLARGGLHVMMMGLDAPLEAGATFPLSLTFESAGTVEIEVVVRAP
jgi:copper(I)-binding protein